jgi:hypothetical protein
VSSRCWNVRVFTSVITASAAVMHVWMVKSGILRHSICQVVITFQQQIAILACPYVKRIKTRKHQMKFRLITSSH